MPGAFPFRTHLAGIFAGISRVAILRWTRFICINELLTLDSPRKLDSNHCDFGRDWGPSETGARKFSEGAKGMARAHAASACVQSDSIKGLAQSIAKPAYHRLLIAEPALRRAVPTLIIAFLITICLGAFVQVVDQNRQKRALDQARPGGGRRFARRTSSTASLRSGRTAPRPFERLQLLLPGLIPSWGVAAGRHVIVIGADQRVLARVPIDAALGDTSRHSRRHQRGAAADRAGAASRRDRHHPAERQQRAGGLSTSSNRCPARSSSSRRRSTRSGGRTRRCR